MNRSIHGNRRRRPASPRRGRITLPVVVVAATVALFVVGFSVQFLSSTLGGSAAGSSAVAADVFTPDGSVISKEPVVVAGVQVDEAAVNLGRQPLDTAVEKTFTLRNTGSTAVSLGRVGIEVLEGCCPEDPILGSTSIAPGQEVPLLFSLPMGMHKGMDGPHVFRLTVPVQNDNGESGTVEIYVKADFG